jgi:hypothetical protein
MGQPFNIFDLGRSENAARLFRVLLQNPTFRNTFAARYSTYTGTAFHPARVESIIDEYAHFASLGGSSAPAIGRHFMRWGLFVTNADRGQGSPSIFSRDTLSVPPLPAMTHYNNTRVRHGNTLVPWSDSNLGTSAPGMGTRATMWNRGSDNPYRWPPHSLRSTITNATQDNWPGVGTSPFLRNQENVLKLRAANAETTVPPH